MGDRVESGGRVSFGRTVLLLLLFGGCVLVFLVLLTYAGYYFSPPILVWLALAVVGAAALATLFLAVKGAQSRLLALAGAVAIVIPAVVAGVFLTFLLPMPAEARVRQIAEAADFPVMLPAGVTIEPKLADGYQPSSDLSANGEFTAHYARFELSERGSDQILTASELEDAAAPEQPGPEAETSIVVDEARELTVLGQPARGVRWHEDMGVKQGGSGTTLVFQPRGCVIRMTSDDTDGNGLSIDEMADIAGTFRTAAD